MSAETEERGAVVPPEAEAVRWIRMTRRLIASPERAYRAWTDPETLARWLPDRVEGSLAPNSRTLLVWPRRRVWWDVVAAEPDRRFQARRPWLHAESIVTTFTIAIQPRGYGSIVTLEDGPFPVDGPGTEAWAEAIEAWTEALDRLRAFIDFSVDIRERSYEAEA